MKEAQPTRSDPVKELAKLLRESGAKVQIGLEAQGHIPTVEEMFVKGKSWDEIGRAIGWEGSAVCRWYIYYLRRKREAAEAELEQVRQERDEANRIKDAFRQKWEEITRDLNRLGDERSEERRKGTWEYIRRHYGKVEDWARKELPEPWRAQFFCCLANGTSGVLSSDYFKESAAEQMFYDQCNRAEASESREKRLKEALEKIAELKPTADNPFYALRTIREIKEIARRALEGE